MEKIKTLCADALAGNLTLDSFYNEWPENTKNDNFINKVYDDIEDLVQHTPGKLISGEIKYDVFFKLRSYMIVYLDMVLLNYYFSDLDLIKTRESILSIDNLTTSKIERLVKTAVSKNVSGPGR